MFVHWPGCNPIGCPSMRAKVSSRTLGVRARARTRRASKGGGSGIATYVGVFGVRRTGTTGAFGDERGLRPVRIGRLHPRERPERPCHPEQCIEDVVGGQVRRTRGFEHGRDGRCRLARVKDGARQKGDRERLVRADHTRVEELPVSRTELGAFGLVDQRRLELGAAPGVDEDTPARLEEPSVRIFRAMRATLARRRIIRSPPACRNRPVVTAWRQTARLRSSNQGSSGANVPVRASNAARISATVDRRPGSPPSSTDPRHGRRELPMRLRAGVPSSGSSGACKTASSSLKTALDGSGSSREPWTCTTAS